MSKRVEDRVSGAKQLKKRYEDVLEMQKKMYPFPVTSAEMSKVWFVSSEPALIQLEKMVILNMAISRKVGLITTFFALPNRAAQQRVQATGLPSEEGVYNIEWIDNHTVRLIPRA